MQRHKYVLATLAVARQQVDPVAWATQHPDLPQRFKSRAGINLSKELGQLHFHASARPNGGVYSPTGMAHYPSPYFPANGYVAPLRALDSNHIAREREAFAVARRRQRLEAEDKKRRDRELSRAAFVASLDRGTRKLSTVGMEPMEM